MISKLFDNPVLLRRIAGIMIILSVIEWSLATFTGLVHSVTYLSHLSQLTFTISLIPWWQGLRVEARQVEEDIPKEVTQKIIEKTNVEPSSDE